MAAWHAQVVTWTRLPVMLVLLPSLLTMRKVVFNSISRIFILGVLILLLDSACSSCPLRRCCLLIPCKNSSKRHFNSRLHVGVTRASCLHEGWKAARRMRQELRRVLPGVAVIDFNSALVLEPVNSAPGCLSAILSAPRFVLDLLGLLPAGWQEPAQAVRVRGPGLTFIRGFTLFHRPERIQGCGRPERSE